MPCKLSDPFKAQASVKQDLSYSTIYNSRFQQFCGIVFIFAEAENESHTSSNNTSATKQEIVPFRK